MWLPKYERKWLKYFFENQTYNEEGELEYVKLPDKMENAGKNELYNLLCSREKKIGILAALERLIDRKLLVGDKDNSAMGGYIAACCGKSYKLTLSGWDIANKYNSQIRWIGLWFNEYRDCGLGFVLGLLGGLLTNIIINLFMCKNGSS